MSHITFRPDAATREAVKILKERKINISEIIREAIQKAAQKKPQASGERRG